jgi:hypothetical protein
MELFKSLVNNSNSVRTSTSSTSTSSSGNSSNTRTVVQTEESQSSYFKKWGGADIVVIGRTIAVLCDENEEKEGFYLCDVQKRVDDDNMLVWWRKKFNPSKEEYIHELTSKKKKVLQQQPVDIAICGVVLQNNLLSSDQRQVIVAKRNEYIENMV